MFDRLKKGGRKGKLNPMKSAFEAAMGKYIDKEYHKQAGEAREAAYANP